MTEKDSIEVGGFDALFAPDTPATVNEAPPWKVLVVDDERDIHAAMAMVLRDMEVEGRPLRLLDAYSAHEARQMLENEPDIALLLLDVVMEDVHAGLDLVRYLRDELGHHLMRVILVTGQPGYAAPKDVVADYEINDYRLKSDLTSEYLHTAVYSALRTYHSLQQVEEHRRQLEQQLAERTRQLEEQTIERVAGKQMAGKLARQPLRQALPESFGELISLYQALLDAALERQIYRVQDRVAERMKTVVDRMGELRAGPRDVLDVHIQALQGKTRELNSLQRQAHMEEARYLLLEIMGNLVAYYRTLTPQ